MRAAVIGLICFALLGCQSDNVSDKKMLPKYQAMATQTHQDEMKLHKMELNKTAAPTISTKDITGSTFSLDVPADSSGITYSINGKFANGTLTQTTPAVVTPPVNVPSFPGQPANAVSSGNLDSNIALNGSKAWPWKWNHDAGTPGSTANMQFNYPVAGQNGSTTAFEAKSDQTGKGGAIWHLTFAANDFKSTHFVYDAWVKLADASQVANVEMDMNQVTPDGKTYILATQCSGYSGTWEYTLMSAKTHWQKSNIPCNPKKWGNNTWHHIQIASHRDVALNGMAYYDWVIVDGVQSNFLNAKGVSAENLGWGKVLLLNFQLDGANQSGTMDATVDNLQIWKW